MWVERKFYEYLKNSNNELISELKELKPLPKYDVFYSDGDKSVRKTIRGNLSYDSSFLSFVDKDYHILAVIPTGRLISLLEVKK